MQTLYESVGVTDLTLTELKTCNIPESYIFYVRCPAYYFGNQKYLVYVCPNGSDILVGLRWEKDSKPKLLIYLDEIRKDPPLLGIEEIIVSVTQGTLVPTKDMIILSKTPNYEEIVNWLEQFKQKLTSAYGGLCNVEYTNVPSHIINTINIPVEKFRLGRLITK